MLEFKTNSETTTKQKISIKLYAPYVILTLLVALAFANSLQNEFVWDDQSLIDNPNINLQLKEIPSVSSVLANPLWNLVDATGKRIYYRPIMYLFFALKYKTWGLNPLGFHLTNIIIHLINTIILYNVGLLLFTSMFQKTSIPEITETVPISIDTMGFDNEKPTHYAYGIELGKLISLIAASIFAVHPVHSEPICVASTGEVILGFFIILSIYFFLKEKAYLSWIAFFIALLTKEPAVMLPFALVILTIHKRGFRKGIIGILPYLILVGVYLILRMRVIDTVFGDRVSQPIFIRILTMVTATLDYIRLLVIPYPLSPFYPARWYTSIFDQKVLIAIVVSVLILILMIKIRKDKTMLFLLALTFLMLGPVIWRVNTFPIGDYDLTYITERFLYVSAMPFSLFVSASAVTLLKTRKKYFLSGWIAIIFIFTTLTVSANTIWKNNFTLFSKIVKGTPEVAFAHYNLGLVYYNQGQVNEAINEYLLAIKLKPTYKVHYNLGIAYVTKEQISEAIREYKIALELKPDCIEAYNNIGNIYYNQGRFNEALIEFLNILKIKPDFAEAHNNLGTVYITLGYIDNAIEHYQGALRLNPALDGARNNLERAYEQKKSVLSPEQLENAQKNLRRSKR